MQAAPACSHMRASREGRGLGEGGVGGCYSDCPARGERRGWGGERAGGRSQASPEPCSVPGIVRPHLGACSGCRTTHAD